MFLIGLINIEIFKISFSFFYSFSFILRSRATSLDDLDFMIDSMRMIGPDELDSMMNSTGETEADGLDSLINFWM